jgi:hypothetical protein
LKGIIEQGSDQTNLIPTNVVLAGLDVVVEAFVVEACTVVGAFDVVDTFKVVKLLVEDFNEVEVIESILVDALLLAVPGRHWPLQF